MLGTMLAELVGSDIVYSFIEAFFKCTLRPSSVPGPGDGSGGGVERVLHNLVSLSLKLE